ncbi:pre-mRNA-splicing factor spp2 [Colletotrichum plurivorum]|uniref:Pre-mRNA-splicing factor n=1 Tax=Colletotrichum plurivorum TaxID=2175906 RepID=A0A8H6KFE5_9PEZI|nr:pre-mRNA-splicing factor spp2 [Colletotrichum plurivorum]
MADSSKAPRIAISFGGSSSSKTNNKKPSRPEPPSSLGKRSRPNALKNGFDSDSDGERDGRASRHEAITEFGGEREKKEKPRDLVIASQRNRNWKDELRSRRGGRNLLPAEAQAQQNNSAQKSETEPADADKQIQWGLTVKKRKTSEERSADEKDDTPAVDEDKEKKAPRTADDDAMDALLGKKRPEEEIVIQGTEGDAYLEDMKHVGEDSTLADYEAIPDGEFGAALLRGMGWDGKMRGPNKKRPTERRQNQLGLGAKKLEGMEDLGQWNQGKKKSSRPRLDEYRRDEEKKRAERKERRGESYRDERDRDRERDREDRDRYSRRDRDRDRDRDSYGHRHRSGESRR